LAFGEKKFRKSICVDESHDGAGQTAPSSTNTYRAEFVEVLLVFVERQKPAKGKERGYSRWDFVIQEEGKDVGEGAEASRIGRLIWRRKAVRFEDIREITKRAISGARFKRSKGLSDNVGGDWDGGLVPGAVSGGAAVTAMNAGWVKLLA
jgi:hypothetical protein